MSRRRALITGINGQDGSYLADILLERDYEVHGLYRHSSNPYHLWRINHLLGKIALHSGDVTDCGSVLKVVRDVAPDEVYHEADQDHVGFSFKAPHYSVSVTVGGAVNVLEAVRTTVPNARVFLPCSATMFGGVPPPQDGRTMEPLSPYACAKVHVFCLVHYYRAVHGMYVSSGVLFTHDSPRRGPGYLLQRICRAASEGSEIVLHDVDHRVDVGHAKDYMTAAVDLLQIPSPKDLIIGTGTGWSIRHLVERAYTLVGRECLLKEVPPPVNVRAADAELIADTTGLVTLLNWKPKYTLDSLITEILERYRSNP